MPDVGFILFVASACLVQTSQVIIIISKELLGVRRHESLGTQSAGRDVVESIKKHRDSGEPA